MAFKVFLSYGTDPGDQVAAWRLQTLATSYGMHVSVPNRNGGGHAVSAQVHRAIDQSDCVLAMITGNMGPVVAGELNYALSKGKVIVPVVRQGITVPPALKALRVFEFSPWNTGQVEAEVVKFLQEQRLGKEKQQAISALVAIGLGLFLLAALSKK
ncbi:MAG: toll/interleukin-1 receptor domain-containing protein [Candidatus Acidiferrales bacterium]